MCSKELAMETSSVGATTVTTQTPTTRGFSDLESEDFFQLLIEELQSQDPMNPTDNKQLLDQLSSIRAMEQTTALNETLGRLAIEQRFGATASLIGNYVAGIVENDAGDVYELQGVVIGVRYESNGQAILELHTGESLPAESVEQITLVENLPTEILEQLESELGLTEEEEEEEEESETARTIRKDLTASKATAGDLVRGVAEQVDMATGLISTLLSPGISVGI
jgi:flagellar basal-body rod modification protein FlgD